MAVTRIKNNQITDSTITYAKIATGTLVGTNFNANLTLNSNVTILGNLTVANNYIQLNSINTYINDPIVVFNNNYTGSLTGYDIGMLVNRNLSSLGPYGSVNTFWGWVEADQSFEALATTDTGTGITSINNSGFANVKLGNLTATGTATITGATTFNGALTFTTATGGGLQAVAIGNVTPGSGAFTTLTTTGTAIASGNIVAASGTASTSTTTGALVAVGGIGVSGAIYNGGVHVSAGNIVAASGTASTSTTTGALVVVGGIGASGAIYAGSVQNTPIGSTTASTGAFTTLTTTGTAIASGNIVAASGTASTNTTTGALVVVGGIGASGVATIGGNIVAASGTASTSTTTGALVVTGGIGASGAIYAGSVQNTPIGSTTASTGAFTTLTSSGLTTITNSTDATSTSTGALVVTGGVGIGANLYVAGNIYAGTIFGTSSSVITIEDSLVYFQAPNPAGTYNYDTGFYSDRTVGGIYSHMGFARSFASNAWVLFANVKTEPSATGISWTDSGLAYDSLITGNIVIANTVASTSTTTGALIVGGGVGIAGATYVGGGIQNTIIGNVTPTTAFFTTANAATLQAATIGNVGATLTGATLTTSSTIIASGNIVAAATTLTNDNNTGSIVAKGGIAAVGNINLGGQAFIGSSSQSSIIAQNALLAARGTSSTGAGTQYTQIGAINATNTGSTDFAAYGNNATSDLLHGFADMGFTGDAFNDPAYTITKPNDAYVFGSAANATVGGNLILATDYSGSYNDIVIATGSFFANAEVARFHGNVSNSGYFQLELPTNASPAANVGAFRVWGGASFSSNVYHGGATILNGSQTAGYDTIIKGKTDNTLLWARPSATYDQVLIGNSATASTLVTGAKLQINSTDSLLLPVGTSAQRPGSAGGTDTVGMFRYNTTLNSIEYYGGGSAQWNTVSTQFTVIADTQLNGDGVTTAFTIPSGQTTNSCIISINGVIQIPTVAYSVSGTTVTFTEAPASGDVIDVRMLTTTQTVTSIASTNGYMQFLVDNNGAYVYTGSSSTAATTYWDTSGGKVSAIANISVASANTLTTLDSFSSNSYRTAKYIIQVKNGANYQAQEVLVVTDGTTATQVTYGTVQTSGNLGVIAASQSGSTTTLSFIATNATNVVRIQKDYLSI